MAQRVVLEDDIDGGDASTTLHFSVGDVPYAIDLNEKNVAAFNKALEKYISKARVEDAPRSQNGRRKSGATRTPSKSWGYDPKAVREWCASQTPPIEVNARGRISADIVEKYHAAGN